ncbi:MAG: histidine phosphatase family protein [Lysinibacillus sp.]
MKLLLIRHGQSEADLLNVHEGRADFSLTAQGREQAIKLAQSLADRYQVDRIIASPLKRAAQTAEIINSVYNCGIIFEEKLMEFNNGVLAGMDREQAKQKYPLPPEGRPITEAILHGESELEFRQRVEYAYHEIMNTYKETACIAIIAHGGTINHLLNILMGNDIRTPFIFPTGDTGLHEIEYNDGKIVIRVLNNQMHL